MAIEAFYIVRDAKGKRSRVTINLPNATTLAQAEGFVTATVELLDAIIYGKIESAGVQFDVTTWSGVPKLIANSLADVEDVATMIFNAGANGIWRAARQLRIPTYNETFTQSGSSLLDLTDPDVDAFVDMMVTGVDVAAVMIQPTDYRAEDIHSLDAAFEGEKKP